MTDDAAPITTADDNTFDDMVLRSPLPILVSFGATWCVKCKALHPTLAAIAADYQDRMKVVHVDVDQSPALTEKFDIASLPALLFFKNGEQCGSLPGVLPKSKLVELIEDFLAV